MESVVCNIHTPQTVKERVYAKLDTENKDSQKINEAKMKKLEKVFTDAIQEVIKKATTV